MTRREFAPSALDSIKAGLLGFVGYGLNTQHFATRLVDASPASPRRSKIS
jgi:hypothetical protein